MRYKRLDLNLLVALDALLIEKSPTRAGERLNLSQSAVSSALARLRAHFDDELLVQVGRRMELTPLARSLEIPVREILLKIQATIDTRPDFDPASSKRHFSIVASDYILSVLLAETIRRASRIAPRVTVEVIAPTDLPAELLDRGAADLVVMPEHYLSEEHPRQRLFEDDYCCVVWSENTLVGDAMTPEQYLELGHVVARFGSTRQATFEEWFLQRYGHVRRLEVFVSSFTEMPQAVCGTNRICTMHRRLARIWVKYLPLRILEVPVEMPQLAEGMQWHKYNDNDPGSLWMRGLLAEVAGELQTGSA